MTRYTHKNCHHLAYEFACVAAFAFLLTFVLSAQSASYDYSGDPCSGLRLQGMHTQSQSCLVPFPYNNHE